MNDMVLQHTDLRSSGNRVLVLPCTAVCNVIVID